MNKKPMKVIRHLWIPVTLLSIIVHWPSMFCFKTQWFREIIRGQSFDTSWYVTPNPLPKVT